MTRLHRIFVVVILTIFSVSYIMFNLLQVNAAERRETDLVLYKTNNYNLSESCTFTGLNGFYEIQYCNDAKENVPNDMVGCLSWKHTYMDYKKVTSKNTNQYKVLNSTYAWTDTETGLRMYKDRICVAIGQGFDANAGDYIDVVLEDNTVVKCIVGDMKAIVDTDDTMRYHNLDGSVVEFIIDDTYFNGPKQYPSFFGNHEDNKKKITKIVPVNDLYEDAFNNN